MPHVATAAGLYFVGAISIFTGLWLGFYDKISWSLPPLPSTPLERCEYIGIVSIFLFFLKTFVPFSLGLVDTFLFNFLPLGGIFYLARQKRKKAWFWAIGLVFLFTVYKILYAYLRVEMILPTVALLLGVATSQKLALRTFVQWKFVPIYLWVSLFILVFPWIINNRGKYGTGLQRIKYVQAQEEPTKLLSDRHGGENVVTRLSLINQLSQVVRIVEEDGYYRGRTLAYWKYIWIPRILWRNKPKTATGAWFAHRLDNTYQRKEYQGTHSWSANMTIPGELYLNFGWGGASLGSLLIGYFAALLWRATGFGEEIDEITSSFFGNLLAFFLITGALFNFGADLQFVVNLMAMYLLALIFSHLWRWLIPVNPIKYAN